MKLINGRRLRGATALAVVAFGLSAFTTSFAMTGGGPMTFNIPAENTAQALDDFAKQAGVQILFPYDVAQKFSSPVLKGEFTRQEALARLLADSGLEIATQSDSTISLRVKEGREQSVSEAPTEVIVTGTHIRGGNPTSPVHTITSRDIDESGYSQIGDVMRSLPQNFSGGQNPGVVGASLGNAANYNGSGASTVNLRGLGSDATLTLVNGHRLSGDMYFQGADISAVPLGIVQRVDVVTDGASALYGADAVAGVVNLILRKDYNGEQLSVRGGVATQGGGTERTASFLAGRSEGGSYALADIEYSRIDGLTTADRDFTSAATTVSSLTQPLKRNSLYVGAGTTIGDKTSLDFDAVLSDRRTSGVTQQTSSAARVQTTTYTPGYTSSLTANVDLSDSWKVHAIASASGSYNSFHTIYPAYNIDLANRFSNADRSFELNGDGTLLKLPSGPMKVAVGVGYRTETYRNLPNIDQTRNITYGYAEILAPLVPPSHDRMGLEELELSVAGRTERYSDFGSSTNPKFGIRYVPVDGVSVHASWGTSFKAPSFIQMYSASTLYLWNATSVGGTGPGTVLMTYGGNPDLKPERSKSMTIGVDIKPKSGITLSANYFHIAYDGRVVQPVSHYLTGLSNPDYAPFVEAYPSAASQANLVAAASMFTNYSSGAYDPTQVVALMDDQYTNATDQTAQGVDLDYRQTFELHGSTLYTFGDGSWLKLRQQTSAVAPDVTLSGFLFSPPKFKARGGFSWRSGKLAATAIINYISGEIDNGVMPNGQIASWTTVDVNGSYRLTSARGTGPSLSLAVANIFDKAPPHAAGPALSFPGLSYDSTNASILGRFVSLTLKEAW